MTHDHHKSYSRHNDCNDDKCDSDESSTLCNTPTLESKALYHLANTPYEFRELDGSRNNRKNLDYGKSGQPFVRKAKSAYNNNDGCSLNDLNGTRPNPREVSNCIFKQSESIPNNTCLSNIFWTWGQFIDHDITFTHTTDEKAPILIEDMNDPLYNSFYPKIPFSRSESIPFSTDCSSINPRQQINSLTPFIDGSNVYGSTVERNNYIREFCGGRLKTVYGNLPPTNDSTMDNEGPGVGPNFVCGDVRSNEHIGLASIHILFVREHNYWANKLCEKHPERSDEDIYQRARVMVEAEIEAITFNEFLPHLLGCDEISEYIYDSDTNPQLSNEFATFAYRFGHSMVPTNALDKFEVRDMFFSSHIICNKHITIGEVLEQFSKGVAEKIDAQVIDDLRSFLFGQPGQGGSDLASLNIQRGRDHGIALINDLLEACNLPTISKWCDITSDVKIQNKLKELYVNPSDIDAWVFGLVQKPDPCKESIVSPLNREIMKDTFMRLRDGDRLWYENRLSGHQIKLVNMTRLSDIIRRNTSNVKVDDDVFTVKKCFDMKEQYCSCKICNPCKPCKPCKPCNPCKPCHDQSSYESSDSSDSSDSSSSSANSYCSKYKHKSKCKPRNKSYKKKNRPVYLKVHKKDCMCHKC
jgi:hypothetical protein